MLFPYNTDAPIYHYPIATVGLILTNTLVFGLVFFGNVDPQTIESMCLQYGEINPVQWVTSNFLHGDLMHLLGNMLFLWGFGLVVEGKLGWYRFLAVYFGIGVVQCAAEQLITLGSDGGSLGASSILYGLMAIACVWAPKNEMNCVFYMGILSRTVDVTIYTFALIYVIMDGVFFALSGFNIATSTLHLMGAAIGFPLGAAMLKMNWVDCENWDLFSVWTGTEGTWKTPALSDAKMCEEREKSSRLLRSKGLESIRNQLKAGEVDVALSTYRKINDGHHGRWELPALELAALINALHREKMWSQSVPLMIQALQRFPQKSTETRLKLAQILLQVERRPKQALAVLAKLSDCLTPAQETRLQKINKLAQTAIEEGELEVQVADW